MMIRSSKDHRSAWLLVLATAVALASACDDDSTDDTDAGGHEGHGGDGDGDGDHTGHTGDGDGDGDHSGHMADGGGDPMCGKADNCTGDELAPAAGDEVEGHMGNFNAMVHSAEDYATGEGTQVTADWVVMLKSAADDSAVTDATVTVQTWSVDCMHDGPVAAVEVTANGDGNYEIPSTFAHGGPWETRLMVDSGGTEDMIHISVCVPGDEHGGSHTEP